MYENCRSHYDKHMITAITSKHFMEEHLCVRGYNPLKQDHYADALIQTKQDNYNDNTTCLDSKMLYIYII